MNQKSLNLMDKKYNDSLGIFILLLYIEVRLF